MFYAQHYCGQICIYLLTLFNAPKVPDLDLKEISNISSRNCLLTLMVCSHCPTPVPRQRLKKGLCGRVHIVQISTQIRIGFCGKLLVSVSVSVSFSVLVSGSANAPLSSNSSLMSPSKKAPCTNSDSITIEPSTSYGD